MKKKQKDSKRLIAWILLISLLIISTILTYMKFFTNDYEQNEIKENPVNNSNSKEIHTTLEEITKNFNEIINSAAEYNEDNIIIKASLNNYSIYISYITDNSTTTYEFKYDNLCLITILNSNEEETNKFNLIYKQLVKAIQKRINNPEDVSEYIDNFLNENTEYDGLTKNKLENEIEYKIDITKKIKLLQRTEE